MNWLKEYLVYTQNQESPEIFHTWCGIAALASAVGRRCMFVQEHFEFMPNFYIMLVAGSASCRKSTAIKIAKKLLARLEVPTMILSNKVTPQKMVLNMSRSDPSEAIVIADELSVFMGPESIQNGLVGILTDLYDESPDWSGDTICRGVDKLKNHSLSILAGTTPEGISLTLAPRSIGIGFTSRVITVYAKRSTRVITFRCKSKESRDRGDSLVEGLNKIRQINAEVTMTQEAMTFFDHWYKEHRKLLEASNVGYIGRKHTHAIKLATLLALSDNLKTKIEKVHLEVSLELLAQNEPGMAIAIAQIKAGDSGDIITQIYNTIQAKREITRNALLKKFWRQGVFQKEMSIILHTLAESGDIDMLSSGKSIKIIARGKGPDLPIV